MVRTSVTHSAVPRVPLVCSYHILTSSVIYYWTDAQQHAIYLLNGPLNISSLWEYQVNMIIKSIPLELLSPSLLSTNFATRGVLERDRQAATNALWRGNIPKHIPQKIPKTIIRIIISELPPTATFHTYKRTKKIVIQWVSK